METAAGIIKWKPKQFPHSPDFYAKYNAGFFIASEASGFIWRNIAHKCSELKNYIASFKQDTLKEPVSIAKQRFHVRMNLSPNERSLFRNAQGRNVGHNNSDKNYGPVLYSRDLFLSQCLLHLHDDKGTYENPPQNLLHVPSLNGQRTL
jgi:hypothetical protein